MIFTILAMSLYYYFLAMESLNLSQCILLILFFLFYVAVICLQQWNQQQTSDKQQPHLQSRSH